MKDNTRMYCKTCRARRSVKKIADGIWKCNICGSEKRLMGPKGKPHLEKIY